MLLMHTLPHAVVPVGHDAAQVPPLLEHSGAPPAHCWPTVKLEMQHWVVGLMHTEPHSTSPATEHLHWLVAESQDRPVGQVMPTVP